MTNIFTWERLFQITNLILYTVNTTITMYECIYLWVLICVVIMIFVLILCYVFFYSVFQVYTQVFFVKVFIHIHVYNDEFVNVSRKLWRERCGDTTWRKAKLEGMPRQRFTPSSMSLNSKELISIDKLHSTGYMCIV